MSNNNKSMKLPLLGIGIAFGAGVGIVASLLCDFQIAFGVGLGAAAGLLIGLVFTNLLGGKNKPHNERDERFKCLIIFLCALALCGVSLWGAWQIWFNPYRGTVSAFNPTQDLESLLSTAQALEDLDYLIARVEERHPACIKELPDNVRTAYERERAIIESSSVVSVLSLWQSAARLLASLGDAHTAVGVFYENGMRLPLSFEWADDALICRGGEYDGQAVIEIGGILITDLYERFLTQCSYELEAWARYSFASRLNRGEYLSFIGASSSGEVSLVLENPDNGNRVTADFILNENFRIDAAEKPPNFDCSLNKSAGVAVFALRQCVYDDEYKAALHEFFTEVKEQNIHSVIVDLRGNPGGNSLVAYEFIRYLPAESYLTGGSEVRQGPILWKNKPQNKKNKQLTPIFSGDVYVLTGADSFSSAVDFAALISDNKLGTVIGEVPGNMPSSYGDILRFQTPNARLIFTVSYKYFTRPDASKRDLPLIPDVQVRAEDALDETMRQIENKNNMDK